MLQPRQLIHPSLSLIRWGTDRKPRSGLRFEDPTMPSSVVSPRSADWVIRLTSRISFRSCEKRHRNCFVCLLIRVDERRRRAEFRRTHRAARQHYPDALVIVISEAHLDLRPL